MYQQMLGTTSQILPAFETPSGFALNRLIDGLLGNKTIQSATEVSANQRRAFGSPGKRWPFQPQSTFALGNTKLEALKRQRFPPEGKAERVAKALTALNQKVSIALTLDELKRIVEDPDLEDQF
ncbi:MAG: hypothetical protein ACREBD_34755 [Blastocatellia bacterium]